MALKKKIMIVMPALKRGGAERVITHILNHLDRNRFDISLLLLNKVGDYLEEVNNDVSVRAFGRNNKLLTLINLYKIIKEGAPDIVFSSLSLNLWVALLIPYLPKKIKFIGRESNMPSRKINKYRFPRIARYLYKNYSRFHFVVAQSTEMKDDFMRLGVIDEGKVVVINNPVDMELIERLSSINPVGRNEKFNILLVGRISHAKRVDIAIDVVAKLTDNFQLTVIGRDMMDKNVHKYAIKNDVSHKVNFLGQKSNPYRFMAWADVLVLTSDYEGFPNVVVEAMACGTPVVAFSHISGLNEIVVNGLNGCLVTSEKEMVECLQNYKEYISCLNKDNIKKTVTSKFHVDQIVQKYEMVFLSEE